MYVKNTAGQHIPFVLIKASDGSALAGATVTVMRCLDGAAQSAVGGSVTEKAGGQYDFAPSQADTNADVGGFLITAMYAIPQHFTIAFSSATVNLTASQLQVKKNVALPSFLFPMFDVSGALKTGLSVTVAIRLDTAAFHNTAASATEIGSTGWYTVDLGTADTNGTVIAFSATATGAVPTCMTIITQA